MASLDLIGSSTAFRTLPDNIEMIAPADSAVLSQGEAGTGKGVIARGIREVGATPPPST
jgi:anaerobic nitric oxide reductase transcription regulator